MKTFKLLIIVIIAQYFQNYTWAQDSIHGFTFNRGNDSAKYIPELASSMKVAISDYIQTDKLSSSRVIEILIPSDRDNTFYISKIANRSCIDRRPPDYYSFYLNKPIIFYCIDTSIQVIKSDVYLKELKDSIYKFLYDDITPIVVTVDGKIRIIDNYPVFYDPLSYAYVIEDGHIKSKENWDFLEVDPYYKDVKVKFFSYPIDSAHKAMEKVLEIYINDSLKRN